MELVARSLLFVPGDRPDRFAKAVGSGADAVIVDLEDAVAPDRKADARQALAQWNQLTSTVDTVIRVNGTGTDWFADDVAMLAHTGWHGHVMLPKAETAAQVADVAEALPAGVRIIALIETARGVVNAGQVCESPAVVRAALGTVDLATELGVSADEAAAFAYARSKLVLDSAAAGIEPPLDGVTTTLDDPETLNADCRRAAALGFGGKMCIHPRQVDAVNLAFTPSSEQLAWARRVIAADTRAATTVDGQMVDRPVVEAARRLLERDRG